MARSNSLVLQWSRLDRSSHDFNRFMAPRSSCIGFSFCRECPKRPASRSPYLLRHLQQVISHALAHAHSSVLGNSGHKRRYHSLEEMHVRRHSGERRGFSATLECDPMDHRDRCCNSRGHLASIGAGDGASSRFNPTLARARSHQQPPTTRWRQAAISLGKEALAGLCPNGS